MNKLATIQKIHSIKQHPNPEVEKLEIAKIMEWPVVVPKGQYREGELVVFIEIDSIVPEANPYFEFMRRQKFRIWNARFKGAPSSGLVCPLSILPTCMPENQSWDGWLEGDDCTEILNITKYERPLDAVVGGDAEGRFPTDLISISDEDNMLSRAKALTELEGKEIYITQKVDGSSTTFIFNNGEFKACSRRFVLKEGSGFPWVAVNKYDVKTKMTNLGRNLAIQAESVGPKLNGNSLELKELEIRVFRVKDLTTKQILPFADMIDICRELNLPMVELLEVRKFDKNIHTVDYFRELADNQVWSTNGKAAEGIVIAPVVPFYSDILGKEWSLKIINSGYK
jgi:RNA ligase (TIGR02306 family)